MKYLKIIGTHLRNACVYFTIAQLVVTIGMQIFAEEGTGGKFILLDVEIILLAFSVIMALIQDVFKIKKLSFIVQLLIHFLLTMAALFIMIMINVDRPMTSKVILMAVAAVVYAVIAVIMIIIHAVNNKHEEEKKEYTPMFKKEQPNKKK